MAGFLFSLTSGVFLFFALWSGVYALRFVILRIPYFYHKNLGPGLAQVILFLLAIRRGYIIFQDEVAQKIVDFDLCIGCRFFIQVDFKFFDTGRFKVKVNFGSIDFFWKIDRSFFFPAKNLGIGRRYCPYNKDKCKEKVYVL
jgi:hypothetical protein